MATAPSDGRKGRAGAVSRALLVALGLGPAACADRAAAGPERAAQSYLEALRAERIDQAYALTSESYRKDHDLPGFRRAVTERREEVAAARTSLASGAFTVERRAELRYGDGDTLPLVMEGGAWRISADPLDFYPQRSPAEALRSFVRAVERKRWDVVWRFVPTRHRGATTLDRVRDRWEGRAGDEIRKDLLAGFEEVKAHLGDPVEIRGDEAGLPLGDRRLTRLVRESGEWRIETLR